MKENNFYNIIGDIHGRTCWKNLVREDSINIFVGDYFDPYEYIPQAERMANFQKIIDLKQQHPETVLLYGNHDLHYLIADEHYSRYEPRYANEYWRAFIQAKTLFHGIAFPIEDKALVTHAGVTKEWYERYFGACQSESITEVAEKINRLWEEDKKAFTFDANATEWDDFYGVSPTHSPLWVRPDTLVKHNLFAGTYIKQIVGHSQTGAGVTKDHNIICVDCLGTKERSYILEI
jgi:hypothetical protein